MAPKEWRCWFCDEVFNHPNDAAHHFGVEQDSPPGCVMKLNGGDNGLLHYIRQLQDQVREYQLEIDPFSRYYQTMTAEHAAALTKAEQSGYDKGLAEGRELYGNDG